MAEYGEQVGNAGENNTLGKIQGRIKGKLSGDGDNSQALEI